MIRHSRLLLLLMLIAIPRPAQCQWVVVDPAAIVKIFEQTQETIKIVTEAKRTGDILGGLKFRLGGLGSYRTAPVLPTTWDTQGAMPPARIPQIAEAAEIIAAMPPGDQKRYWENQLALQFVSARTQSHSLKQNLAVQTDAAGPLSSVINALMGAILSGSDADHSATAILDKIAIGAGIQAHQNDGLAQINIGTANVLGVINQRQNNSEVEQLNLGLETSANAVTFGQSYISGSAAILRAWRYE